MNIFKARRKDCDPAVIGTFHITIFHMWGNNRVNESNAYYFSFPLLSLCSGSCGLLFDWAKNCCNNPAFCCYAGNVLILAELCQYSLSQLLLSRTITEQQVCTNWGGGKKHISLLFHKTELEKWKMCISLSSGSQHTCCRTAWPHHIWLRGAYSGGCRASDWEVCRMLQTTSDNLISKSKQGKTWSRAKQFAVSPKYNPEWTASTPQQPHPLISDTAHGCLHCT